MAATSCRIERVAIVGSGGAGKSTFARELGARSGLPVIHLDRLYWKPGWVETPTDEWIECQRRLLAADRWIADGNYGATFDERFARADTVIVIARHRLACLLGALRRTITNHGEAIQAEGCPERFQRDFYKWIWNYPNDGMAKFEAAVRRHPHLRVITLRSRRDMRRLLAGAA